MRCLLLLLLMAVNVPAFTLIPISATLEPTGKGSATTFKIENSSSNKVAFQVSILTREMDALGNETNQLVTNLFSVFPPQGTVPPMDSQTLRIVWKGDKIPGKELSFRLLAEELPVDFAPSGRGVHINMLVRYMGALYVCPKGAKPDVRFVKCEHHQVAGKNYLVLTLENKGKTHQVLSDAALTLTPPEGAPVVLKGESLKGLEGENLLAESLRHLVIECPPGLEGKALGVKVNLNVP